MKVVENIVVLDEERIRRLGTTKKATLWLVSYGAVEDCAWRYRPAISCWADYTGVSVGAVWSTDVGSCHATHTDNTEVYLSSLYFITYSTTSFYIYFSGRFSGDPGLASFPSFSLVQLRYRDGVDNTVEENYSTFSLIQMHWLLSARECGP